MARSLTALLCLCLVGLYTCTNGYKFLEPPRDSLGSALLQTGEPLGPAVHAAGAGEHDAADEVAAAAVDKPLSEGRRLLAVDASQQGRVPVVPGGLVRNPEARILYRNIEVLADGTAVVTSQTNLPNDLPRSATSFSYT